MVPVYFLDADLPENSEWDRTLTHYLYGGDQHYRLARNDSRYRRVKMLRALGYDQIRRFHMNEGHSSLLAIELLDEEAHRVAGNPLFTLDIEAVRKKCVFTSHTPVPAGQDKFSLGSCESCSRSPRG